MQPVSSPQPLVSSALLPSFGRGQRIGLFGGSFNPPHQGHYHVAAYALKRLQLDWVWWLVALQNPLKSVQGMDEFSHRVQLTKELASPHPRFHVSALEAHAGAHSTIETLISLRATLPLASFVWIMGADSFAQFHRWQQWQMIAKLVPLAVIARPGYGLNALQSPTALRFARARLALEQAPLLATRPPPAWVFLPMPLRYESSTQLRALHPRA